MLKNVCIWVSVFQSLTHIKLAWWVQLTSKWVQNIGKSMYESWRLVYISSKEQWEPGKRLANRECFNSKAADGDWQQGYTDVELVWGSSSPKWQT